MNTSIRSKYTRLAITLFAALFVAALVITYVRSNILFFVSSSYPEDGGQVSTSSNNIWVTFNQELNPDQQVKARLRSTNETIELKSDIKGRTLYLYNSAREAPVAGLGKYRLLVDSVSSKKGNTKDGVSIDFEIRYLGYRNLPKSEQKRQISESNSFENPIARKLPYRNKSYSIEYQFPNRNLPGKYHNMPILYIYMNFGAKGQDEQNSPYADAVRKYRKEALKWIESQGVKPTDYLYKLGEDSLEAEFTSHYPGIETVYNIPQRPHEHTGDGVPPEQQP